MGRDPPSGGPGGGAPWWGPGAKPLVAGGENFSEIELKSTIKIDSEMYLIMQNVCTSFFIDHYVHCINRYYNNMQTTITITILLGLVLGLGRF